MAFKTYGENDYKGFVLLRNKKNNKVTKHYISAVSGFLKKDAVKLYIRNASGDSCFEYAKRTKTRLNKWDMKKITTKNRPKK